MRTKVWKGGFSVFGWIYDIQKYGKQQLCYFPFQQNIEAFIYGNNKNRFRMALKMLLKGFYAGLSLGNNVFYAISSRVGILCYIAFAFSWWISLLFFLWFPNDIILHPYDKLAGLMYIVLNTSNWFFTHHYKACNCRNAKMEILL